MSRGYDELEPEEPSLLSSALEFVGSVAIALAAALCSILMQARNSPAAMGTMVVCGIVLSPFIIFACVVMFIGLMCCVPVVFVGLACAFTPILFGQARALWKAVTTHTASLTEYAKNNPVLVAGVSIAALPLLPGLVVRGCHASDNLRRSRVPTPHCPHPHSTIPLLIS